MPPVIAQQTRGVVPMLGRCWPSVVDDGPTSAQDWAKATYLLRYIIQPITVYKFRLKLVQWIKNEAGHVGLAEWRYCVSLEYIIGIFK